MHTRRVRLFTGLLVSTALTAAACGGSSGSKTTATTTAGGTATTLKGAVKGGTLIDLQNFSPGEPSHIDPQLVGEIQGSQPGQLMWDMLTKTNYTTSKLEPSVAESWTNNAAFTHWDFKLRASKFSNGDPVLPSSFVFAWTRLASKAMASEVAYHITSDLQVTGADKVADGSATTISGLKADDTNMTLSIDLDAPLSSLPNVVSHLAFAPQDPKVVNALADQTKYEETIMVGNGPYKEDTTGWRHNQDVTLVRNDAYTAPAGYVGQYLDKIVFVISKDQDSAFATFEAGQGDTGYIPQARFAEVKAKYSPNLSINPSLGIYYWDFNMKDPVVGGPENVKLRQAIALVIDKQAIIDKTYNGSRKVATGFTPPGVPGYKAGLDQFPDRDVAKAKTLLAEWETATGKKAADLPPIRIQYGSGAGHNNNAQIIEQNMSEIGIKTQDDGMVSTTYFKNVRKGVDDAGKSTQFFRGGWIWDYITYDNGMFPLFGTKSIGGDNLSLYSNPAFDDLITKARATAEGPARDKLYQDAESLILNTDTVSVPLNWYTGQIAYSPKVHNVIQSPLQFVAYDTIYKTP